MTGTARLAGLRRLASTAAATAPDEGGAGEPAAVDERCELCAVPLAAEHGHVADLTSQRLLCTCRPCALLFTVRGAAGGRYLAVPDRRLLIDGIRLDEGEWDRLQVPVDLVFFFHQSGTGADVAFYPGPGGAVESELSLDAWREIVDANPVLRSVEPDVEAVLVRRQGTRFSCFVVPIDACYELVGLVRQSWTGFAGGAQVWARIDAFFERQLQRSRVVAAGGA